jgi:pimeloyl-ACP methyl ester carboxylesterase
MGYTFFMRENIAVFQDTHHRMKPWPPLAAQGRVLSLKGGDTLFYYDSESDAGSEAPVSGGGKKQKEKPAVLFIHGLGDDADSWRHVMAPLSAAGFRALALDLPGFGRSVKKGRINANVHAEAVLALLHATGAAAPDNPAVLAGSSMGAVIAEAAAFRRPDLVKTLILMDGCFPESSKADKNILIMGLPFIGKKWYRAFRQDHEGAWRSLYGYYHNLDAMPEADKQFLRERVIARVESDTQERAYFASLRSFNLVSLFGGPGFSYCVKHFPGKIFMIWGEEDRVRTTGTTRAIRFLRPDTAYTVISGAGHLPHQEKPLETAAMILDFLKGRG